MTRSASPTTIMAVAATAYLSPRAQRAAAEHQFIASGTGGITGVYFTPVSVRTHQPLPCGSLKSSSGPSGTIP